MDVNTLIEKIKHGDIENVKKFIRNHPDRINQSDGYGRTLLMQASENGNTRIMKLFLEADVDVNIRNKFNGYTALHSAVFGNHREAVEELFKKPTIQVNPQDNRGRTPLHLACLHGHTDIVGLLFNHIGIKPNVVNKDGDTPLHFAVLFKQYDVVTLMLSQDSVELEVKNHKKMTPLLEAVSRGHLGITHCLIARGANVNDVDGEGNSCLHLAVKTEVFDSEGAPMDILNECCTDLNLKTEERLSGVVVARYLASQGADFHHKNNNNNTPLDLIKDPKLRKKFETFLPPQCLWCRNKEATTKVHPCGHLVTCEECSNTPIKRCLRCAKPVTNRTGNETSTPGKFSIVSEPTPSTSQPVETPTPKKKISKVSQPTPSTSQPVETPTRENMFWRLLDFLRGFTSQPVENRTFEDKETQTLEEPIVCPNCEYKASYTEPVKTPPSTSQPVDFQTLDERFLLNVACQLGGNWWKVGILLGITNTQLGIIRHDFSGNVQEQSFQMLLYWSTHCDPQEVTMDTLRAALKEAECIAALECLTLNVK